MMLGVQFKSFNPQHKMKKERQKENRPLGNILQEVFVCLFVLRGSHYVTQFNFKLTVILLFQLLSVGVIGIDNIRIIDLNMKASLFSTCFQQGIPSLQLVMMNEPVSMHLRSMTLRVNAICTLLPSGVQMVMFHNLMLLTIGCDLGISLAILN